MKCQLILLSFQQSAKVIFARLRLTYVFIRKHSRSTVLTMLCSVQRCGTEFTFAFTIKVRLERSFYFDLPTRRALGADAIADVAVVNEPASFPCSDRWAQDPGAGHFPIGLCSIAWLSL